MIRRVKRRRFYVVARHRTVAHAHPRVSHRDYLGRPHVAGRRYSVQCPQPARAWLPQQSSTHLLRVSSAGTNTCGAGRVRARALHTVQTQRCSSAHRTSGVRPAVLTNVRARDIASHAVGPVSAQRHSGSREAIVPQWPGVLAPIQTLIRRTLRRDSFPYRSALRRKERASAPSLLRSSKSLASMRMVATDSSALKKNFSCSITPGITHMRRVAAGAVNVRVPPCSRYVEV